MEYVTNSPEQTRSLGARLAKALRPGDVVLLLGDMGAGKSELSRGIARGLGIDGPVPSPTFTIMQAYDQGRCPLYHFDWYRLESSEELYEMGLEEYLGGDGIALVEWPSQAWDAVPETYLEATLTPDESAEKRTITLRGVGGFHPLTGMEETK
ncbi:MAG: tRNA (adenosine(37)-N6)-threonylcarbamoyltransferase complex ATPase subunit type 1 TsaE [Clostridia bacterium]|nr:tRNA (adenosine(37)-N6)-threonylcarbamoyltransferase complex ATPase subunit type 1 TsaE [Clostridia bacterium]